LRKARGHHRAVYDALMARRAAMESRVVKTVPVPADGLYVPPTVIRLDSIASSTPNGLARCCMS
jgi:RHH-type proline utilization regulon transcriptional repressor/proline dehydrogenase/delta 1-pyrroline-5-carboxylate dehydrogenase